MAYVLRPPVTSHIHWRCCNNCLVGNQQSRLYCKQSIRRSKWKWKARSWKFAAGHWKMRMMLWLQKCPPSWMRSQKRGSENAASWPAGFWTVNLHFSWSVDYKHIHVLASLLESSWKTLFTTACNYCLERWRASSMMVLKRLASARDKTKHKTTKNRCWFNPRNQEQIFPAPSDVAHAAGVKPTETSFGVASLGWASLLCASHDAELLAATRCISRERQKAALKPWEAQVLGLHVLPKVPYSFRMAGISNHK